MRKYELMVLLSVKNGEAQAKQTETKVKEILTAHGALEISSMPWGKKDGPLPTAHGEPGLFTLYTFSSESGDIAGKVGKLLAITEGVLRYGTLRIGLKTRKVKAPPKRAVSEFSEEAGAAV